MPEKDEVNVIKMLIDIGDRLARVEENTKDLHTTDDIAVRALAKSEQNLIDIKKITSTSTWAIRTAIWSLSAQ